MNRRKGLCRRASALAAVAVTAGTLFFMAGWGEMLWLAWQREREELSWLYMVCMLAIPVAVGAGIVAALVQRLRELKKGELDEAGKY